LGSFKPLEIYRIGGLKKIKKNSKKIDGKEENERKIIIQVIFYS
jgi:hypothetical protein